MVPPLAFVPFFTEPLLVDQTESLSVVFPCRSMVERDEDVSPFVDSMRHPKGRQPGQRVGNVELAAPVPSQGCHDSQEKEDLAVHEIQDGPVDIQWHIQVHDPPLPLHSIIA